MSVDVVESVLAAARVGAWGLGKGRDQRSSHDLIIDTGKKEEGWDEINRRNESLLEDTVAEGNEFQRLIVRDATVVWEFGGKNGSEIRRLCELRRGRESGERQRRDEVSRRVLLCTIE